MKEIHSLDSNSILKLYMSQKSLNAKLRAEIERVENHFISQQIREIVEEEYNLGKVVEIFEMFGGYTSRAFRIVLEKDRERKSWFFRKYMKPKPETEVLFEHNLLLCARKNGFTKSAVPIVTNEGKTYVSRVQGEADYQRQYYFTVYEFLEGEEPYDWNENEMPRESYLGIASVVSEFHNSISDFDPGELNGAEPPILEFIRGLPEKFRFYHEGYGKAGVKNCFTEYLHSQLDYLEEIARELIFDEADIRRLPVIPIQCDVHPGNFKFRGDECIGVFDFEAAKMDIRIFEIALGIFNCFSSWLTETDGIIYLDRAEDFLRFYNKSLMEQKSSLEPLNETEKRLFCEALQLSNMYMIQWCARVYHTDMTQNHYEYLYYLKHLIRSVRWVSKNRAEILDMTKRL